MKTLDKIYRWSGLWIIVWFGVLGVVMSCFWLWGMNFLTTHLNRYQEGLQGQTMLKGMTDALATVSGIFWPFLGVSLLVIGFLLWASLRTSIRRAKVEEAVVKLPSVENVGHSSMIHPESKSHEQGRGEQQWPLHLLSLLQREGRLVDFLQEDLTAHGDAEIGAAVRQIQETCHEVLGKYVAPTPIMDSEEGETVTIEAGFDPNTVKLVGNISGDPPFKGIVQHRGWRAARVDLPTLSGSRNPAVIVPAEVEIT